jgi:hypothetical protein
VSLEGRTEGARELILAVFRLGVADYLGHSYSHDGDAPVRNIDHRWSSEAATFLKGAWAASLADLIGLDAGPSGERLAFAVTPRRVS